MKKRKLLSVLGVCSLFIILSCVTINIYFPEAAVKEAAEEIVDEVRSDEEKEKKEKKDISAEWDDNREVDVTTNSSFTLVPSLYAQEQVTKVSSPKIRALKDSLKDRFPSLVPFYNQGRIGETNDGMDIALVSVDLKNFSLQFAGANNPLIIIRDKEFREIKGDRMSISFEMSCSRSFTNHKSGIKPGDSIYLFSDGYADQFGGPQGKKFMYRRFRHLLLTIHQLKMKDQKAFLEESIEGWIGNLDQVDDILIIGIKPLSKSRSGK